MSMTLDANNGPFIVPGLNLQCVHSTCSYKFISTFLKTFFPTWYICLVKFAPNLYLNFLKTSLSYVYLNRVWTAYFQKQFGRNKTKISNKYVNLD